jgi:hypothetical protein
MSRFSRLRSPMALTAIAACAAAGLVTTGVALAAPAASGYKACANSSHKLALENSSGNCPHNYSKVTVGAKGPRGATGPSGVLSFTQYRPSAATPVTGGWAFLGSPPQEHFSNKHTAALVTATVDEASSTGGEFDELIGVCYEQLGSSTVTNVAAVQPEFAATADYFWAQTVSGVVGKLSGGTYTVGLCAENQTGVSNGQANVTIEMAQTASGVTYDTVGATSGRTGQ